MRHGLALLLLLGLPCPLALAAPPALTVVPVLDRAGETSAAPRVAAELALRCPGARQLPFPDLAPLLPTFTSGAPAPAPLRLGDVRAEFFRSQGGPGTAARFIGLGAQLERDPVALLAVPARRAALRELYLYAARALLQGGDVPGAEALLLGVATRLADLPGADAAQWGPAMEAADQRVRQRLPAEMHLLRVEGPAGWAVHVDEQPVGALPSVDLRLRPGRHAVLVVGPSGTRVSWSLDLPTTGRGAIHLLAGPGPIHLLAEPALSEVCPVLDLVGLCSADLVPRSAAVLARLAGSDLVLVREHAAGIEGWRLRPGLPALGPARVQLGGGLDRAATLLTQRLCAAPADAPHVAAPLRGASAEAAPRKRRLPAWPGPLMMGAGLLLGLGAVPYFIYDGRCIDSECARVYDFQRVGLGLTAAGATLLTGGAIWLGLALR